MKLGVVITGVIDDYNHFSTLAPKAVKFSKEIEASFCVEHAIRLRGDQLTVLDSNCPEKTDTLARWRMKADGIGYLRGNPHPTPRTVLLKVNFIHCPEINVISSCQSAEFFYAWLAGPDQPELLADAVYVSENQAGGRGVDTGAPLISLQIPD